MKYEANTKTSRNQELVEYCEAHPELGLREVGEVYGISGSRVAYIKRRHYDKKRDEKLGATWITDRLGYFNG